MTVKELRARLATYEDDTPVLFQDTSYEHLQSATFVGVLYVVDENDKVFSALVIGRGAEGHCQGRVG